jgi:ferrochelatase
MSDKALLVMHYGTPSTMDDVLPYYTHIRRGRAPSAEQLADLTQRYQSIGGPSPLRAISERQAAMIHDALGFDAKLYIGQKHASPFIRDAVCRMANEGIHEVVGLVLAPHYSTYSVAEYEKYALGARDEFAPDMKITMIERWGTLPAFIAALVDRVNEAMRGFDPRETLVIFSAHSLPARAIGAGDPYQSELLETSELVAHATGLPHWTFAFQSASQTGESWLGPDILEVIQRRAPAFKNVVACTVGFVSDHLEVLYDLGIEARDKCAELGLEFRRAETINDDRSVMSALADLCSATERAATDPSRR